MSIKYYKPNTPTRRFASTLGNEGLTKSKPNKAHLKGKKRTSARDSAGRMSVRRKGGGHKQRYREIDFRRENTGIIGTVQTIEYDPNRSANIALVVFQNGDKRYILAPKVLRAGQKIQSGPKAPIQPGNALPLSAIPDGTQVHNVELHYGKGGQMVRSAGSYAIVQAHEGDYVTVRLPSGESRKVFSQCFATIGIIGNEDHMNVQLGKAGRSRWLGKRPKVRGVVMNPIDHPHGGGEGRTSGGRHPVSPSGVPTKGYRTRKKKKYSDKMIVKRRKK
ncbi:MAG: 50S ribosomal protein L2 [Spirochaetales bacterium]|nr:50S ribosomal protein L2 [Spirochaetales bacterium]MCF7937788.1 50S ribosomal protein L2 [Spirochaetales bacterium]